MTLRFLLAVGLLGLTELIVQVVLTRDLLALFLGSELSIALVLAMWLVGVAAGSALGGRVVARITAPERAFAWTQVIAAVLGPASLALARRPRPGELTAGQVLGPGAMLAASMETLVPVCVVFGLQFVFAARAAARVAQQAGGPRAGVSAVAAVYALEAGGAVVGGAAFHYALADHLGPFRTLAGLGLLNVVSAAALLRPWQPRPRGASIVLTAAATGLFALAALGSRAELASLSRNPRWEGMRVLDWRPSRYGQLVAAERAGQVSIFQSGLLVFTSQDDYANEVTAHLPLLACSEPRRVLLIGGAATGVPGQILKHPGVSLDCVELDPRLIDMARRHMPSALVRPLSDPRLHLHAGDGRLVVKRASHEYDVIIANVPDPNTAALNRFYTLEFFREVSRGLRPGGVAAVTLTGSAHHLSGSLLQAAATLYYTMRAVFPDLLIVPGETMVFLGAARPGVLPRDWRILADRLRARRVATDFVNEAWLQDALLPFRREMLEQTILDEPTSRLNTDLNPVGYYQQTTIWLDQLSPGLARPVRALSRLSPSWSAAAVVLAVAFVGMTRGRGRRARAAAVLVGTAAIGAFGLAIELLALLVFQAGAGYLYHALGILIAAFMAGLAVGAAVMSGRAAPQPALGRLLIAALATAALFSALLPGVLGALLPAERLILPGLVALLAFAGSLVGAVFPIASALYAANREPASSAAAVYAADLLGSAGAGLVAGALVVPLLGVAGVCYSVATILVAALILSAPLANSRPSLSSPTP